MKRLLAASVALGLVILGHGVANADDLYNGDLDILGAPGANGQANPGPDGWSVTCVETLSGAFDDGIDSETWCNYLEPGGYGVFFKPFQGSTNANPALDNLISVWFYQDNPSTPNTTYTLSAYAAGQANYSGYQTNQNAPLFSATGLYVEFLDGSGNPIVTNSYDLIAAGLSDPTDPVPSVQFTTPVYTAPAGTATVRAGAYMINTWNTSGAQSFLMDVFDLESTAPPGSPVITNEPAAAAVSLGQTASFTVGVSNTAGVTYAWYFNGSATPLTDSAGHIANSGTRTLTIENVSAADVGHYQAIVSNGSGLSRSTSVPLALLSIALDPAITITGHVGDTYEVNYTTNLIPPIIWTPLLPSPIVLKTSPQTVVDTSGLGSQRFYEAVFLH
jgi:hypothetical protein